MKIVTLSVPRELLAKALNLPEGMVIASARMSDYGIPMFDVVCPEYLEGKELSYQNGQWIECDTKGQLRGFDLEESLEDSE